MSFTTAFFETDCGFLDTLFRPFLLYYCHEGGGEILICWDGSYSMKRFLIAGALALAAGQAMAADLPPAPPPPPPRAPAAYVPVVVPVYSWSGFYLGGNIGYGFGTASSTGCITGATVATNDKCGTLSSSTLDAFIGGGQIGAQYQWGGFVAGVEGDWQYSGQSSTQNVTIVGTPVAGTTKLPWFATLRGRAGWAVDRVLFYATGGATWFDVNNTLTSVGGATQWVNTTRTQLGWNAGVGVEWAFAEHWTGKVEYLFMEATPSVTQPVPTGAGIGGTFSTSSTIKDNIIRGGINFKF